MEASAFLFRIYIRLTNYDSAYRDALVDAPCQLIENTPVHDPPAGNLECMQPVVFHHDYYPVFHIPYDAAFIDPDLTNCQLVARLTDPPIALRSVTSFLQTQTSDAPVSVTAALPGVRATFVPLRTHSMQQEPTQGPAAPPDLSTGREQGHRLENGLPILTVGPSRIPFSPLGPGLNGGGLIIDPGKTIQKDGPAATIGQTTVSIGDGGVTISDNFGTKVLPIPNIAGVISIDGHDFVVDPARNLVKSGTTLHAGDAAVTLFGTAVSVGADGKATVVNAEWKTTALGADGRTTIIDADGKTTTILDPNGVETISDSAGPTTVKHPSGITIIMDVNGTKTIIDENGRTTISNNDGSKTIINKSSRMIIDAAGATTVINGGGHTTVFNNDGSKTIIDASGRTTIISSDGSHTSIAAGRLFAEAIVTGSTLVSTKDQDSDQHFSGTRITSNGQTQNAKTTPAGGGAATSTTKKKGGAGYVRVSEWGIWIMGGVLILSCFFS